MEQILIVLQFVPFSLGIVAIAFAALLCRSRERRVMKVYIVFLSIFNVKLLVNVCLLALSINEPRYYVSSVVLYQVTAVLSLVLFYLAPWLLNRLLSIPIRKGVNRVLIALTLVVLFFEILHYFPYVEGMPHNAVLDALYYVPLVYEVGILVYLSVVAVVRYRYLRESREKSVPVALSLLFFASFIVFYRLVFKRAFFFEEANVVTVLLSHWIFYTLWNIVFVAIIWNAFRKSSEGSPELYLEEDFIRRFGLTKREAEIVELMLQGLNNREIGEKLFISQKTAQNHVHHVYLKTSTNSRLELSYLVRKA